MRIRVLVILLAFIIGSVSASEQEAIFSAEVMLKSKTLAERNAAIKRALSQVLQRLLVGESNAVLQQPAVQLLLDDAPLMVRQYHYTSPAKIEASGKDQHRMHVIFDETTVQEHLQDSRLSFWIGPRPKILVFMNIEKGRQLEFFDAESMSNIDNSLTKAAREAGLVLLYPLMDLEDHKNIAAIDSATVDNQAFLPLLWRYGVDVVLAGKIRSSKKCWQSDWVLYFQQELTRWQDECSQPDAIGNVAVQGAYRYLSSYYAVNSDAMEINTAMLKITGINGKNDMKRVIDYLKSVALIQSVTFNRIERGNHYFEINYAGDRKSLANQLLLDRVIVETGEFDTSKRILRYRLLFE